MVTGFESLRGMWGKQLADAFTIVSKRPRLEICNHLGDQHIHLEVLEKIVDVDAERLVVCQPGETANIESTTRITVHLGETCSLVSPPAISSSKERCLLTTWRDIHTTLLRALTCGLDYPGLDLDRTTQHVLAIQFNHGAFRKVFRRQVHKAV